MAFSIPKKKKIGKKLNKEMRGNELTLTENPNFDNYARRAYNKCLNN